MPVMLRRPAVAGLMRGRVIRDRVGLAQVQAVLKHVGHLPRAARQDPFLQAGGRAAGGVGEHAVALIGHIQRGGVGEPDPERIIVGGAGGLGGGGREVRAATVMGAAAAVASVGRVPALPT